MHRDDSALHFTFGALRRLGKRAGITVKSSESFAGAVSALLSLRDEIAIQSITPPADRELSERDVQLARATRLSRSLEIEHSFAHRASLTLAVEDAAASGQFDAHAVGRMESIAYQGNAARHKKWRKRSSKWMPAPTAISSTPPTTLKLDALLSPPIEAQAARFEAKPQVRGAPPAPPSRRPLRDPCTCEEVLLTPPTPAPRAPPATVRTIADDIQESLIEPECYIGSYAVATGLTRNELNGRLCKLVGFQSGRCRFEVQFTSGLPPVLMSPHNLQETCFPALVECPVCHTGDVVDVRYDCPYCAASGQQRVEILRIRHPNHMFFQLLDLR